MRLPANNNKSFDVIIIGAGIGGLICGCFLAKSGLRVLISERHSKPGGYCTSFKRKQYIFDSAPHCFGSYRPGGLTRTILEELGVQDRLAVLRPDPTDTIITPDHQISYWADTNKTIEELQSGFPKEAQNIKKFFSFLSNPDAQEFARLRSRTFGNVLDGYFSNPVLKSVLAAPLLAFNGLPPSLMSAFVGTKIFSEFLLDGGYYPAGGMQMLPDALADRFREFGGELRLGSLIRRIVLKDKTAVGVVTERGEFLSSKYVVSDCDARQTFLSMLGKSHLDPEFHKQLKSMVPALPNFILYLGVDEGFSPPLRPGTTTCFFSHYDLERAYRSAQAGDVERYGGFTVRFSHDKTTLGAMLPSPFRNKQYWDRNKEAFMKRFIDHVEKMLIPGLTRHLTHVEAASPYTLYRYTLNYRGASHGWAGISSQFARPDFKKPSFLKNLYLTSHWTTFGVGISGVIYFGKDTAKIIMKKEKI